MGSIPGKSCGPCTMCCKVLLIAALDKQPGTWCPHATPGKGCGIYPDRLRMCRTWPMSPDQLAIFPRCSYTFTEIDRRPMPVDKI